MTNAFRLAHRASEDRRFGAASRNMFRAIATEIWKAHGKLDVAGEPAAAPVIAEPAGDGKAARNG
jgi:hypothetical protein